MKNRAATVSLILLTLLPFGCAVRTAKVEEPGFEVSPADDFLAKLKETSEAIQTLSGRALAVYRVEDKIESFRALVAVDKSRFQYRLDLYDYVFNKPLVSFVRSGNKVLAVLYQKKQYLRDDYDRFDFQKMTGVQVPKEIFLHSILGAVYLSGGEIKAAMNDSSTLTIEEGGFKTIVYFNVHRLPLQAEYVVGTDAYLIEFSKYKDIRNVPFPHKVTIESGKKAFEISYTELQVNVPLGEQVFSISNETLREFSLLEL